MYRPPKLIEIRNENDTGSILHRCAPGIIKAWMKEQPGNCERSATKKAIEEVENNVGGGTVVVKGNFVRGKGCPVLNTYHLKYMERPDTLVVIPECTQCQNRLVMKLVDESQLYRTVTQSNLRSRSQE